MSRVPPPELEPSIVTWSMPFRTISALAEVPLNTGEAPDAGLIVSVLVALLPPFALIVIGNVSPA